MSIAKSWPPATLPGMSRTFGFIGMMIVVAVGGYIYVQQAQSLTQSATSPKTTIDVTAVRMDLIGIANAERRYWATNSRYASLEDLRADGGVPIPTRGNYTYSAEASANNFRIVATYSGPNPDAPRRISIDETMEMKTE